MTTVTLYCDSIISTVNAIKLAVENDPSLIVVTGDNETEFDFLAGVDDELDGLLERIEDGTINSDG